MQPLPAEAKRVYKVEEIAAILRVSPETIYRKIESAELSALDLTTDDQKQYRVARSAIIAWLGEQQFYELFTPSDASGVVYTLLNSLNESEKTELFDRAIAWARERRAERPLTGRTATAEEIRARFAHPGTLSPETESPETEASKTESPETESSKTDISSPKTEQ